MSPRPGLGPRVTVLGAGAAYPTASEPCSGFLVEWDGLRLVLDLGYGTLASLLAVDPSGQLDAVLITHEHPDHCADLHALARRRHYAGSRPEPIPLCCPPGVLERVASLEPDFDLRQVFSVRSMPGEVRLGRLRISGRALPHFVPTVGFRIENADGTAIAYTGDTGPDPALLDLGRDTELFIVDATDRPDPDADDQASLLNPTDAGEWAGRAGARRLLLTHLWPGRDHRVALRAASSRFAGPVDVAHGGLVIDLG